MRIRPTRAYIRDLPTREGCVAKRVKVWDLPIGFYAYHALYDGVPQDVAQVIENSVAEDFWDTLHHATHDLAKRYGLPPVAVYSGGRSGGWAYLDKMRPDDVEERTVLRRFVVSWTHLVKRCLRNVADGVRFHVRQYQEEQAAERRAETARQDAIAPGRFDGR